MGTDTGDVQKECPSCGSRIAESAVRCDFCKSSIGRCTGCGVWIVEGTQCFDCGKSTARRVKKEVVREEEEEAAPVAFQGSGAGLFVPLMIRQVLVLAWLATVVLATAASGVAPLEKFLADHGVRIPATWPVLWGASGGLLLAVMTASRFVRRYRATHTHYFGQPLDFHTSIPAIVGNTILAGIVLAMTAGLGVPWLYARQIRSFHRSCKLTSRGGRALEWNGTGEAVLGRFFLMLLLLPLAVATAGFGGIAISWMWLSWEQRHLQVSDRNGILHKVRFTGTFGSYFARAALGWLVTLITLGLYWPWAKCADWAWVASKTEAA